MWAPKVTPSAFPVPLGSTLSRALRATRSNSTGSTTDAKSLRVSTMLSAKDLLLLE